MKKEDADSSNHEEPLFDSYLSGDQITLIPRGKILYTKEEFLTVEKDRDFWRSLFYSLLEGVASMPGDEKTQRQVNGLISRFAALAKSSENADNR